MAITRVNGSPAEHVAPTGRRSVSASVERQERPTPRLEWVYVAVSLVLGFVLPQIPWASLPGLRSRLGKDEVIALLSAMSSGMMAFTGIVFSLLFIVLQFGSSAYTPHLVTLLMRNRTLRHAGGVFTGTFLYSLMALRGVGEAGGGTSAVIVWTAFAWLVASVYLLLQLVRVFQTLAIDDVLDNLGKLGHHQVDRAYGPYAAESEVEDAKAIPMPGRATQAMQTVAHGGEPNYVLAVDAARLAALACAADVLIRVPVIPGDSVTAGVCLASVEGGPVSEDELRAAIVLGRDRSFERSPRYAIRLLVDIAIRALSTAVNDPTTAVHGLDQIEAILVHLGNARLTDGPVRDEEGKLRVVLATTTWGEYLELGTAEIQQYGAGALQVQRRLAALFGLLLATVPDARKAAVERLAREHSASVCRAFPEGRRRDAADGADRQGLGHSSP